MAKLALVFFVSCIAFTVFHSGKSLDPENEERMAMDGEDEEIERRAHAKATATANAGAATGRLPGYPGYPPGQRPLPPSPVGLTECYACSGCPQVPRNMTVKQCPYTGDVTKQKKCVTYAEKYSHLDKPWYIRGCAAERGTCAEIKKAHEGRNNQVSLLSCKECEGDRCNDTNGAGNPHFDVTMAVLTLVITPLLAKFTLS